MRRTRRTDSPDTVSFNDNIFQNSTLPRVSYDAHLISANKRHTARHGLKGQIIFHLKEICTSKDPPK